MSDTYEVFAIRYGRSDRRRSDSFIGGADPHDMHEMAYYVWLVRNEHRAVVVDTGFDPVEGQTRGREFLVEPARALADLGTDPDRVEAVILSHMHWDHSGNRNLFGQAHFHVQAAEMAYATGPCMTHPHMRLGYGREDVKAMVDRLFDDRVRFHKGRGRVAPGIEVVHIGGHTAGIQATVVATAHGPLVLASDTAVFYESIESGKPFPFIYNIGEELDGYRTLLELGGSIDRVIPGHDVRVMARFPAVLEGVAWRLDEGPRG